MTSYLKYLIAIWIHRGIRTEAANLVLCNRGPDWQLSSVAQVCNSSLPPLSMVEDLYVKQYSTGPDWEIDAIENTLWLELLLTFIAVKNLYLSKNIALGITDTLQELVWGGRITEVLPSLWNIFLEGLEPSGPFHENIQLGQFVVPQQFSGHPITFAKDCDSVDGNLMKYLTCSIDVLPFISTLRNFIIIFTPGFV
jgi:hypothetical protein